MAFRVQEELGLDKVQQRPMSFQEGQQLLVLRAQLPCRLALVEAVLADLAWNLFPLRTSISSIRRRPLEATISWGISPNGPFVVAAFRKCSMCVLGSTAPG